MKKETASLNLYFGAAIEGAEPLPLEFEGRHEIIDSFDLGIGKHRFVEGDSLGEVVIDQRNGVMEVMTDVLVGWVEMKRCPSCLSRRRWRGARSAAGRLTKIVGHDETPSRGPSRRTNGEAGIRQESVFCRPISSCPIQPPDLAPGLDAMAVAPSETSGKPENG